MVVFPRSDTSAQSPSSIMNTALNTSLIVNYVIQNQEHDIQELKAGLAVFHQEKYKTTGGARGKNVTESK